MTSALIIGDLQVGIIQDYPFSRQVLDPLASLLPRARAAGVLPVFVHTALRRNRADLAATNPLFTALYDSGETFREGAPGTAIHPNFGLLPTDVLVLKRRTSAFTGTDLDLVLRARQVDQVILAGVATSAMIAATAYAAADRDYQVTVLGDGCADADDTLHRVFLSSIFPALGMRVEQCASWAAH